MAKDKKTVPAMDPEVDFPEKSRKRAARRKKDFSKAARKMKLRRDIFLAGRDGGGLGRTGSVHAFSKAKIHCSCPMCAFRYKKKGHKAMEEKTPQDQRAEAAMALKYKEYAMGAPEGGQDGE